MSFFADEIKVEVGRQQRYTPSTSSIVPIAMIMMINIDTVEEIEI